MWSRRFGAGPSTDSDEAVSRRHDQVRLLGEDSIVHVLTKIFVVLVSLLAVLLVPLVVVYTHNEDNYKARFQQAEARAAAARVERDTETARFTADISRLDLEVEELTRGKASLERDRVEMEAETRQLESRVASEEAMKMEINAKLATLATALESGQRLTDGLVTEVRTLRSEVLSSERQKVELDEALRDVSGQLEVAVQARRALQEELQRLSDELSAATDKLGQAYAQGFLGDQRVAAGVREGIAPDVSLQATVINVTRSIDQVLAEIDAGSRDGVKVGWVMSVGRGGDFMGKLRIISVDINRATGVVSLESPIYGRQVEVRDVVFARSGRD
jgi:hypothetical protein